MKVNYWLLLSILFLMSCASETQQKGIDEIKEIWGDKVRFVKGIEANNKEGTGKYFKIVVQNPNFFIEDAAREGVSGRMATIIYKNFSDEEKKEYIKLIVELQDGTGGKEEAFSYPVAIVKKYHQKETTANKIVRKLYDHDYAYVVNSYALSSKYEDSLTMVSLVNNFSKESRIKTVIIRQITKEDITIKDSKREIIIIGGKLILENAVRNFNVVLDANLEKRDLMQVRVF